MQIRLEVRIHNDDLLDVLPVILHMVIDSFFDGLVDSFKKLVKLSEAIAVFEQKDQHIIMVNGTYAHYALFIEGWVVHIHKFYGLLGFL